MDNETTGAKTTAEAARIGRTQGAGAGAVIARRRYSGAERRVVVVADVPGASSDTMIDVKFEDGTLEIQGGRAPRECDGQRGLLRENEVGDYYRSFQVSEAIDRRQESRPNMPTAY